MLFRAWGVIIFVIILLPAVAANLVLPSSISLGGSSANPGDTITATVNIQNNYAYALQNFALTFNKDSSMQNFNFNENLPLPSQLLNGSSQDATLTIDIPEGFSAVDNNLDPQSFIIGTITLTAQDANGSSVTSNNMKLTMQIGNRIQIGVLQMEYLENKTTVSLGSTVTVIDGEDLDLFVIVKNTFSNSSNIRFLSGDVSVDVNSNDIELDETEVLSSTISPSGSDTAEVRVRVDDENQKGSAKIEIEITAIDEYGGLHGAKSFINLDIDQPPETEEDEEDNNDNDHDSVRNEDDLCPYTEIGCVVDLYGCHVDSDYDDICDGIDVSDDLPDDAPVEQPEIPQVQSPPPLQTNNPSPNVQNNSTNEEVASSSGISGSGFLIFIIGLVVGIIVTAGFFLLLRG